MKVETGLVVGKGLKDSGADFTHATGLSGHAEPHTNITDKDYARAARQDALKQFAPSLLLT